MLPDQHLGRNTAYQDGRAARRDGRVGSGSAVRRPRRASAPPRAADPVEGPLQRPHALHASSRSSSSARRIPAGKVIVHPEVHVRRRAGRRRLRLDRVHHPHGQGEPGGIVWAVGTEIHLVNRLAHDVAPERTVVTLDALGCLCSTMFRVSPNHLLWVLEGLRRRRGPQPHRRARADEDVGTRRAG